MSHLVRLLFDFGINRKQFDFTKYDITVYDDDIVDTKNLLHQNFSEADLNKPKVEVMETNYAITPIQKMMTVRNHSEVLK